jgi:hypothetical protein
MDLGFLDLLQKTEFSQDPLLLSQPEEEDDIPMEIRYHFYLFT